LEELHDLSLFFCFYLENHFQNDPNIIKAVMIEGFMITKISTSSQQLLLRFESSFVAPAAVVGGGGSSQLVAYR